jgi:hypothetical protein
MLMLFDMQRGKPAPAISGSGTNSKSDKYQNIAALDRMNEASVTFMDGPDYWQRSKVG